MIVRDTQDLCSPTYQAIVRIQVILVKGFAQRPGQRKCPLNGWALQPSFIPLRAPVFGPRVPGGSGSCWMAGGTGQVRMLFVEHEGYRGLSGSRASLTSGAKFRDGGGAKESAFKKVMF